MAIRQIWIPHLPKMKVKDLQSGSDPTDPPLTQESIIQAPPLTRHLHERFGIPAMLFQSPKVRCVQTAAPAVATFGDLMHNGILVITLNTLAQPDNGDYDPTNPNARKSDGLFIYGPGSSDSDWLQWFKRSLKAIRLLTVELQTEDVIWVFTHRPIVAAARWFAKDGSPFPRGGDMGAATDKSLLPYCVFEDDGKTWREIPKE